CQGPGCARGKLRSSTRCHDRRPRSAARLRQHVGGHGFVCAGTYARPAQARALSDVGARARVQRWIPDDCGVSLLYPILILVALARLLELAFARRNTLRLLAQGAIEAGQGHYPFIMALHAAWFLSLLLFAAPDPGPHWPWLVIFLLLQPLRLWVIR